MKNLLKIISIFLFGVILYGCKVQQPSAEVNATSGDKTTITVRSTGVGKNLKEATIDAERRAFDILFFRGIPQSQQEYPMIGTNENTEKQKHKAFFDEFYGSDKDKKKGLRGRYGTFIISSSKISNSNKTIGNVRGKEVTVEMRINLLSLRRELENSKITRKFGF